MYVWLVELMLQAILSLRILHRRLHLICAGSVRPIVQTLVAALPKLYLVDHLERHDRLHDFLHFLTRYRVPGIPSQPVLQILAVLVLDEDYVRIFARKALRLEVSGNELLGRLG